MRPEYVRQAMDAKRRMMKEKGDGYDTWVLDELTSTSCWPTA